MCCACYRLVLHLTELKSDQSIEDCSNDSLQHFRIERFDEMQWVLPKCTSAFISRVKMTSVCRCVIWLIKMALLERPLCSSVHVLWSHFLHYFLWDKLYNYKKLSSREFVNPKMENFLISYLLLCHSKPISLLFILKTQINIFLFKPLIFLSSIKIFNNGFIHI